MSWRRYFRVEITSCSVSFFCLYVQFLPQFGMFSVISLNRFSVSFFTLFSFGDTCDAYVALMESGSSHRVLFFFNLRSLSFPS